MPIQLAQCWFPGLAISRAKYRYICQIKYTEAILLNSTRKLLWFEISKMLIAVKNKFIVISYNFRAHFRSLQRSVSRGTGGTGVGLAHRVADEGREESPGPARL